MRTILIQMLSYAKFLKQLEESSKLKRMFVIL